VSTPAATRKGAPLGFRGRLFLILLLFALLPSAALTLAWSSAVQWAIPLFGASGAVERLVSSGERTIATVRGGPLSATQQQALADHERALRESRLRAQQLELVQRRAPAALLVLALIVLGVVALVASRVAGHLSRALGRPLGELVRWAELIGRGEPLPAGPPRRGAPEFEVLRRQMRTMSEALAESRARALEAERLAALRETARQVAHELKNPLTPIRFAVSRLKREVSPSLSEAVEVLEVETERLERMARSFAQFGRMPEGPRAAVDLGELVRYTTRATVPPRIAAEVEVEEPVPMVNGHYDALARAVSNVLINAVEACTDGGTPGTVRVHVRRTELDGRDAVEVSIADTGCGIPAERLERIWDPYVTHKPGGTGLGLAIARQTVLAHEGVVSAESEPGRGTRVRIVLPATRNMEQEVTSPAWRRS
jgi:signal transduction histidine kinase